MKEILLSFVSPMKMKKYRFMSILVAILIFIISIYCIALPHQLYMKQNKDLYLSQKSYVNAYIDLPQSLSMDDDFINSQYYINDEYAMISTQKGIKVYNFEDIDIKLYGEEETKTVDFYIVFDVDDIVTTELNTILEEYSEIYQDDDSTKASYISYLYYVDKLNMNVDEITSQWKLQKFEEYHNKDTEEISELMGKLNNFDLFGIEKSGDDYLLIFLNDSLITQIPYYDEDSEEITYPALSTYYSSSEMKLDFRNIKSLNEFGNYFADMMFEPLSSTDQTEYLIQVVGYVLLFPAIYVLILFWAMKKRGVMKTYKEYYNIASIASIMPLLVTFALSWFIPNIAPLYGALFCVFTLFAFIKINSTPELGD